MHQSILLVLLIAPLQFRAADTADLIIHNAKVVTVDAKFTIANAIAVAKSRIIAVGTSEDALKHRSATTRVINAEGKTVLPGLMDSHTHPLMAGLSEWK